ncbi:hypothetical protein [Treponema socranskii]|uniref:hypothetical protein n=1 Tax=Treponema socranskii TaxID=53419 RepID=UPI003D924DAA
MKKTALAAVFASIVFINFTASLFAEDKALAAANRKTAVRFLKLAEDCFADSAWDAALAQAKMGLAYDDSVADLHYIEAAVLAKLGHPRAEILPLAERALTEGVWTGYNRDGARLLYADLLCDTGSYEKAVSVLDEPSFIYSADAEYVRLKAYYRMRSADTIDKARSIVNGARKIYPNDTRFPLLFFRCEYAMKGDDVPLIVQSIADSLIARMGRRNRTDAELEIYACLFASGDAQKRMLQAFAAAGMRHPLYARAALSAGLISQEEAVSYFFNFADKTISLRVLSEFASALTEENAKRIFVEHIASYGGVLTVDTDGDSEADLTVRYERGRPASISYDKNTDGVDEWSALCDFGAPVSLSMRNCKIEYGNYPSVLKAEFTEQDSQNHTSSFDFADGALLWSPFSMDILREFKDDFGVDFFVPVVKNDVPLPDSSSLLLAASKYEVPSTEREGATISFSVLDGKMQTADYYAGGKAYARAVFENGFPKMRSVDHDGDGVFETVEVFGRDTENAMHLSSEERLRVSKNILGSPKDEGVYIKAIRIDRDGDASADFIEEYATDGAKTVSWDTDGDGLWDVRYERMAQKAGEALVETASFYLFPERRLVVVASKNGIPVKVVSGGAPYDVRKGKRASLYWIGEAGTAEDEARAASALASVSEEGKMTPVQGASRLMLAVRIGGVTYAAIVPDVPKETASSETAGDLPKAAQTSQTADETGNAGAVNEVQNGVRSN